MVSTALSWRSARIATHVWRCGKVGSTQAEAKRLIARGVGQGALVIAAEQSRGRGRLARTWQSPPGNLYLSFVLRPAVPLSVWGALTLVAALALVETIDALGIGGAALKWPNDVLVRGRKVAGILAETEDGWLVLGVGVNINAEVPADLPRATSLRVASGAPVAADDFLRELIERYDALIVAMEEGARFGARWAARMETLGRQVRLDSGEDAIDGIAESVQDDGALVVRRPDGTRTTCYGGEISVAVATTNHDTNPAGGPA